MIIPTPYWVTYSELVKIAKGIVVEVHTSLGSGFKIHSSPAGGCHYSEDEGIPLFFPCNPSGPFTIKRSLKPWPPYSQIS